MIRVLGLFCELASGPHLLCADTAPSLGRTHAEPTQHLSRGASESSTGDWHTNHTRVTAVVTTDKCYEGKVRVLLCDRETGPVGVPQEGLLCVRK